MIKNRIMLQGKYDVKVLLTTVILLGFVCLCVFAETDVTESQSGINGGILRRGDTLEQGNYRFEKKPDATMVLLKSTEEQEATVCDEFIHSNENFYISIAQIHEQLVSMSWPDLPSFIRSANAKTSIVFQIKVSTSGMVCSIEPISKIGENAVIRSISESIMSEVKKWKFMPNRPFWGLIAIRYEHTKGYRLL